MVAEEYCFSYTTLGVEFLVIQETGHLSTVLTHDVCESQSLCILSNKHSCFNVNVSGIHAVLSHYGFDLYFLTASDIKQIFTCPLASYVSSCIVCLFISLPIKIIGLFVDAEEWMIYILDTAPLLGSSFANVFSFITYIKVSWLAKMSNLMR